MKLTREELYERVWQKPIREVAAELGISDVGLAKACRKSNIPLPHQGHWLKKPGPARERLKTSLPAPLPGARLEFDFQGGEFAVIQVRDQAREDAEKRLAETPRPETEDTSPASTSGANGPIPTMPRLRSELMKSSPAHSALPPKKNVNASNALVRKNWRRRANFAYARQCNSRNLRS